MQTAEQTEDRLTDIFTTKLERNSSPEFKLDLEKDSPEDFLKAILITFYARSINNGKGERMIFYKLYGELFQIIPHVMVSLLDEIVNPETGGSWKDLNRLVEYFHDNLERRFFHLFTYNVVDYYANRLNNDFFSIILGDFSTLSLAAKYAPIEKSHFWNVIGKSIAVKLYILQFSREDKNNKVYKNYRNVLTKIRDHLEIPERLMCAGQFSDIDFEKTPIGALKKYGKYAYSNMDKHTAKKSYLWDRILCSKNFSEYKKEKYGYGRYKIEKINPFQDLSIDSEDLPKTIDIGRIIPMIYDNAKLVLDIASQIGEISTNINPESILCGMSSGSLHENPFVINIPCKEHGILDLSLFLQVYLNHIIDKKIKPEDTKGYSIIIFTDFLYYFKSKDVKSKFDFHKYEMPKIIIWIDKIADKVSDLSGPVAPADLSFGVTIINGFSPEQIRLVLSGDINEMSPYEKMIEKINDKAFDPVRDKAKEILEEKYNMILV